MGFNSGFKGLITEDDEKGKPWLQKQCLLRS